MHVPNVTVRSQPRWQYPEIESDGRLALDALLSGESHPIVRSGLCGTIPYCARSIISGLGRVVDDCEISNLPQVVVRTSYIRKDGRTGIARCPLHTRSKEGAISKAKRLYDDVSMMALRCPLRPPTSSIGADNAVAIRHGR